MKLNKKSKKLAQDLGVNEVDAYIMELKASLYRLCSQSIKNSEYTHKEIAELVGTSRARVTRLSNMGENSVSVELLIRIISTLEEKSPIKIVA